MSNSHTDVVLKLEENSRDIYQETSRILLKIADNILEEPMNMRVRVLKKDNATILNKVINVSGGIDCLKAMGFEEKETNLILPRSASLNNMQLVRDELFLRRKNFLRRTSDADQSLGAIPKLVKPQNVKVTLRSNTTAPNTAAATSNSEIKRVQLPASVVMEPRSNSSVSSDTTQQIVKKAMEQIPFEPPLKPVALPPLTYMCTNNFLRQIEQHFHQALTYGDKDLQKRALTLVPLSTLQNKAKERLRSYQEKIKKEKLKEGEVGLQDFLILELLEWFKEEFFTWVDTPDCTSCGGPTKFEHMSADPNLLVYTNRVEMHKCACGSYTPFPRYNDLNILLETRRGRCGEWANTFTLLCRAMGWDARIVFDETDHVWTEVYSEAQKRWLHCDSCENACDTPLIYENGWRKNISYVLAYSDEEVQDVTWRYTSNHKTVALRRKKCCEEELASALQKLRTKRQQNFSPARRQYLTKRLCLEFAEFMVEKKPKDSEQQGRVSGSTAWKLSRGETKESSSYTWILKARPYYLSLTIRYSTALDQYEEIMSDGKEVRKGWEFGVLEYSNIFRKFERDWGQVYLARTEGSDKGRITWMFEITEFEKQVHSVDIVFQYKLYENGNIRTTVSGSGTSCVIPEGCMHFQSDDFTGSKFIKITSELSGGKGPTAWQHAQLFRQSHASPDFPFVLTIIFK